jgi:hypothetical protein
MKTYTFVCLVHRLDFDTMEDKKEKMFFVESQSEDLKTAHEKVKDKLYQINGHIENRLFLSCNSLYTGTKKVKTIQLDKLNYISIEYKSFNIS